MSCLIPEPHENTTTIPLRQWTRWRDGAQSLAEMTTFGAGGAARQIVNAQSEAEIIDAVKTADAENLPVLMLGGGSNILASSAPFDGVVIRDMRQEITTVFEEGCPGARMHVTAGTPWDAVVIYAVEHGWMGMESLSGLPGTAGAAIVQNIGAYGQEVSGTVACVRTFDRLTASIKTIMMSDLELGYRTSILKQSMKPQRHTENSIKNSAAARLRPGDIDPHLGVTKGRLELGDRMWGPSPRWIVLDVDFQLRLASLSEPVRYAQLAQVLGVTPGERVPSAAVRAAVLELRTAKAMVLDDNDRDTFSAGSFFTNPVLTEQEAADLPDEAPRYAVTDPTAVNQIGAAAPKVPGFVKTSAAWLIDHAGFKPGYGDSLRAALSSKHSLALTNRGAASGEDIAALAREIRQGVHQFSGVWLEPEPVLIGLNLD